jgi:L-ascorbate metabolism protein UlaG (beta-lactamase superfamily)
MGEKRGPMTYTHTVMLPPDSRTSQIEQGSITFIGTATVILRYAGFTILTDPNFLHKGDHVHLGYGQKSTRLTNPAMELKDVPPFDVMLLSHMHEDHFDRSVEHKLDKGTAIITTPHAAAYLHKKKFYHLYPLETWQTLILERGTNLLRLTSMPGRHGPGPLARLLPPVMGSMLEFEIDGGKKSLRIYISGDTLMYKDLKEIPKRYPDIDLALLHLGGTRVVGILLTMDGKQGVEAIKLIKPHEFIPIHYNDYDVFKSPLEDFQQAVNEARLDKRAHYLKQGDTYTFQVPLARR